MSDEAKYFEHLIVPAGTQVVTLADAMACDGTLALRSGAVGGVIVAPTDNSQPYRIRFTNGSEAAVFRSDFNIRKHHQAQGLIPSANSLSGVDLRSCIIYSCIVGSRAYGLDVESSDTDRRGIYLPPAELHWSLYGVPEQLEDRSAEECYWELQKFLTLALKANPNVLECLYSPRVEAVTPLAQELLDMRSVFVSKLVYQTYNGYVLSQFKKLEQDLRSRGAIQWKHAMHLIRLLLQGVGVLKNGELSIRIEEYRDLLLQIRNGEMLWQDLNEFRLDLHRRFDSAFANTRLPERPNSERANAFLIRARRFSVNSERRFRR